MSVLAKGAGFPIPVIQSSLIISSDPDRAVSVLDDGAHQGAAKAGLGRRVFFDMQKRADTPIPLAKAASLGPHPKQAAAVEIETPDPIVAQAAWIRFSMAVTDKALGARLPCIQSISSSDPQSSFGVLVDGGDPV